MRNEIAEYPEIELVFQEVGNAFQVQFRKKAPAGAKETPTGLLTADQRTSTGQVPDKYRTSCMTEPDMLKFLEYCQTARSVKEMMHRLGLKHRETFLKNYLNPLIQTGLIIMTIPDKPRSPKQRYVITPEGRKSLQNDTKKT